MLENGFIKLHRSLLNWEWYDDLNTSRLFIHLLLTVNYEDKKWHGLEIKRGSRVCSLQTLAAETKLTVQNIRTCINKLKSTGELTSQGHAQNTVISILNYDKYQAINTATNKPTASNQQEANEPPASEQQATNNNERTQESKKANKEKEKDFSAFEQFWEIYPKKKSKGDAEKAWEKTNPSCELIATICNAVAKAKTGNDWQKDGGKFVPYPATWLRAKGWEDEIDQAYADGNIFFDMMEEENG